MDSLRRSNSLLTGVQLAVDNTMDTPPARAAILNQEIAYALLRVTLGTNLLLHGVTRIIAGHAVFLAYITKQMQSAPLPSWFLAPFSYALPWMEALVGLFLLVGFFTRNTLIAGCLVMLLLQIGTCLAQNWQVAGDQLLYVVIYFILLSFVDRNRWSLDHLFSGNGALT
jgi:thiosulfate dehydrogenase [quinone] large subunit